MKRASIFAAAALAAGLAGSSAALAESFTAHTEDTGMSWRAWNNEVYDQSRSSYLYPGGGVPGNAYSAPGIVYGGNPAAVTPYDPYGRAPAYAPGPVVTYPAPGGY